MQSEEFFIALSNFTETWINYRQNLQYRWPNYCLRRGKWSI